MSFDDLLTQVRQADLLRFTTAGSVDDGKSTLIGRLLHDSKSLYEDQLTALEAASAKSGQTDIDWALATDGLRAEREQRITIDVAYRHFSTPRRRFIIADTPGHEQYTRNMVTGASTADLAVILIDAANGVLTQSRRHGFLASLLGIRSLVVAVNKMDLVDYRQDVFEAIRDDYRQWSTSLPSCDLTFIPLSALQGDNVVEASARMPWYNGPPLLSYLETVPVRRWGQDAPFRFPIQHVLRPNSEFRGYCGSLASGQVHLGDEVLLLPGGHASRVTRILGPDGDRERAVAPQSVTLCLADDHDLGRGDLLATVEQPPAVTTELTATLVWMDQAPLQPQRSYLVKQTTRLVRGRVGQLLGRIDPNTLTTSPCETLQLNEIGQVRLALLQPLVCDPYDQNRATGGFILIDPDTNGTVAAGLVNEPLAAPRPKPLPARERNLTWQAGRVTLEQRQELVGQRPVTLWLTGLSGAGKSTFAEALEERLVASGHNCVVLDGDNVRHGLNSDLGFSPRDRGENIRRVAEVAKLFNQAGLIVITAFISPYREDRAQARAIVGERRFLETFIDAPLDECERRDPKGLYAKARAGQIPEFTGVTAPYEPPELPELRLDTAALSVPELLDQAWEYLVAQGCL